MRLVYIAGAYRAPTPWQVEQNIRAAEALTSDLLAYMANDSGLVPVCTHMMTRGLDGIASDENMLSGTMAIMRACDAVLLVHNWRDSAGARAEVEEAKRIGIPVFGLAQTGLKRDQGAIDGLIRWAKESHSEARETRRDRVLAAADAYRAASQQHKIAFAEEQAAGELQFCGDFYPGHPHAGKCTAGLDAAAVSAREALCVEALSDMP